MNRPKKPWPFERWTPLPIPTSYLSLHVGVERDEGESPAEPTEPEELQTSLHVAFMPKRKPRRGPKMSAYRYRYARGSRDHGLESPTPVGAIALPFVVSHLLDPELSEDEFDLLSPIIRPYTGHLYRPDLSKKLDERVCNFILNALSEHDQIKKSDPKGAARIIRSLEELRERYYAIAKDNEQEAVLDIEEELLKILSPPRPSPSHIRRFVKAIIPDDEACFYEVVSRADYDMPRRAFLLFYGLEDKRQPEGRRKKGSSGFSMGRRSA